jgi:S1-C subfamily serine protease
MKRQPLYRKSAATARPTPPAPEPPPEEPPLGKRLAARWRGFGSRYEKPLLVGVSAGLAVALVFGVQALQTKPRVYTQDDINAAVAYTMKKHPEPSHATVAADVVRPSVVRVTGYDPRKPREGAGTGVASEKDGKSIDPTSVGSGVVIDEKGTILTNWHVASSAQELKVTFSNGLISDADIVGAQIEDDLAVIRPHELPDDLKPATLVSTKGLRPGDEVVAVGFPFGIGPTVTSGVVSGLRREWVFAKDRRARNLIQFDAAANPGNSGGPLVNRKGEVLGIVTGILNPTKQAVFIGIGFAVPIENAAKAVGNSPF